MPAMTRFEAMSCRSAPWRLVSRRVVLPWALQGFAPAGHVLEIGAGSGAMAAQLLAMRPGLRMTVTDIDASMLEASRARLRSFGERVTVGQVDATALPFPDGAFDGVASWIMLHHTIAWEKALAEALRVVRPGGHVVGYDLTSSAPFRLLHRGHGSGTRTLRVDDLQAAVATLPVDEATVTPSLAGLTVRFLLRRAAA